MEVQGSGIPSPSIVIEVELVGVVLIDDGDPHFGVALDLALGWLE
jgi:hypothetical protein